MKIAQSSLIWVLWLLGAGLPVVSAESPNLSGTLSACAKQCLYETVPLVNCSLVDIACQCSRPNLITLVTDCMIDSCTLAESLQLVQVDGIQCNRPHNSRHPLIIAFAIGAPVVTYIALTLRIISRLWTMGSLWWDDYCHIIAGAFAAPLSVFANLLAWHGFGYHLYDLKITSIDMAEDMLFWFYMCQIWWAIQVFWIKLSILCLYLRIFPSKRFRVYVFIVMGCILVALLILLPMDIWQCNPIHTSWTLDFKEAYCLSLTNVAYANAAINIATEVAILVLPLPMLHTLPIQSTSRKIGLYSLIGAGILVIAIASARIPSLNHLATINDPTFNNVPAYVWTAAEGSAAHVCAAIPAIRSLVVRLYKEFYLHAPTRLQSTDRYHDGSGAGFGVVFRPGLARHVARHNEIRPRGQLVKSWVGRVPSMMGEQALKQNIVLEQELDDKEGGSPLSVLPPKSELTERVGIHVIPVEKRSHSPGVVIGQAISVNLKSKYNANPIPTITMPRISSSPTMSGMTDGNDGGSRGGDDNDDDDDGKSHLITIGVTRSNLPSATYSSFSSSGATITTTVLTARPSGATGSASPAFNKDGSFLLPPTPGSAIPSIMDDKPLPTIQQIEPNRPSIKDSSLIPPLPPVQTKAPPSSSSPVLAAANVGTGASAGAAINHNRSFLQLSTANRTATSAATATAAATATSASAASASETRENNPPVLTYMSLAQITRERELLDRQEAAQRQYGSASTPMRIYTPTPIPTRGHRFGRSEDISANIRSSTSSSSSQSSSSPPSQLHQHTRTDSASSSGSSSSSSSSSSPRSHHHYHHHTRNNTSTSLRTPFLPASTFLASNASTSSPASHTRESPSPP